VTLFLNETDRALLRGDLGPGKKMAMSIIVQMAEVSGAENLLSITSAHIDSSLYMGEASLEFSERLVEKDAKVCVPSSLNVSGLDEQGWEEWAVPPAYARNALRQMKAYLKMGCIPTWTCSPYQSPYRPIFGQQIAWGESNAIAFANTVIGARTERYPDFFDICAAITGRVPAIGLHCTENRAGQFILSLQDIPISLQVKDIFYPLLGYLTGKLAGDRIPVIEGLQAHPNEDQLKALCAAAASSGGVALIHIVGITPEAHTLEDAVQDQKSQETILINLDKLKEAFQDLNLNSGATVGLVVLGCPHLSIEELHRVASMVKAKRRHDKVQFLLMTNRDTLAKAEIDGVARIIRDFGGRFVVDTCILCSPILGKDILALITNSGKCAYYTPGLLSRQVHFGSLETCVQTAITGVVDTELPW
jgi:predicted aconitase